MIKDIKNENYSQGIDWGHKDSQTIRDVKYFENYHFGQAGWVCPKCGRIWNPLTMGCYHCNTKEDIISGVVTAEEIVKQIGETPEGRMKNE